MNIVKLTDVNKNSIWINMSLVVSIKRISIKRIQDSTILEFGNHKEYISETPEEIYKIMTTPKCVLQGK